MRRLTEWKLMNPPASNNPTTNTMITTNSSSAKNFPDQTERFKKLLAQIDKEKIFNYNIITLTDNALVFELLDPLNNNKTITIAIVYKPYTNPPIWRMGVNNASTAEYKNWNEVLKVFEIPGIIKDISSLKESFEASIVEDFELYENLWK